MNRKEFFKVSAAASLASLLSPLSAYAEKFESEGKKVKVAVIGCGSVSTQYFPHISKCPYVEIVACCDIKPDRAQKAAKQYNIPKWYKHIDDMLSGSKFDLMLTLTDMQVHGELNRKALMAGRNVWSEKPLANSYKEGKELYDLATSKGIRIWGAPAVVNSPQFAFMAEQINKGTLGNLACAHGHYGHEGPSWSAFFYEPLGGSMPDLGVYNIATLTGLLGPAKSVVAMTTIVTPERTVDDKGKIKVREEDNAMIIMEHEKGVLSHIECGFNYFGQRKVRCTSGLIITGELPMQKPSDLTRCVIVEVDHQMRGKEADDRAVSSAVTTRFLKHIAEHYDLISAEIRSALSDFHADAVEKGGPRQQQHMGELSCAFQLLLEYAKAIGVIDDLEMAEWRLRLQNALGRSLSSNIRLTAKFERENVSNVAKVIVDAMRSGTISLAKNKEKFTQKQNKYAGFEGHKPTVAYIRLASLQELLTSVSGKVWTDSATGKLLRENGLVEVGKDGHTAKSKFPKLGRFVPLNKEKLEKQAKIRK